MLTFADVEYRNLLVINGLESRYLKVEQGQLQLMDSAADACIAKIPMTKMLALLVVGHTSITTALMELCNKNNVPIVVTRPNLRPVFYYGRMQEGNYLLRQKQYAYPQGSIEIARHLVKNKALNQLLLLGKIRDKTPLVVDNMAMLKTQIEKIEQATELKELLGIEGIIAKYYFQAYFEKQNWTQRLPRQKPDPINAMLDMGYTTMFNYMICMVRLFGFDPYVGVYHQLFHERKSLVCDLMEPFRCIIERKIRKSLQDRTFKMEDFENKNGSFQLAKGKYMHYTQAFFEAIMAHKMPIFEYVQAYYRFFMCRVSQPDCPYFHYE